MQLAASPSLHQIVLPAGMTGPPGCFIIEDDLSTSAGGSDRDSSDGSDSRSPQTSRVPSKPGRAAKQSRQQPAFFSSSPQHPASDASFQPWFRPPPGLEPPCFGPPPGIFQQGVPAADAVTTNWAAFEDEPLEEIPKEFVPKAWRKELTSILRDLTTTQNVAGAVARVRRQNVPLERQAREFTDLLTRAAEETRGMARRLFFAFAAGLIAGSPSAFDRSKGVEGLKSFFTDVYAELREEVPRLETVARAEMLPTIRSVLPAELLVGVVPPTLAR